MDTRQYPLDALAHLAAASGFDERGSRPEAELHLGIAISLLSCGGQPPQVTLGEVKSLLTTIHGIAYGAPRVVIASLPVLCTCGRPALAPGGICQQCTDRYERESIEGMIGAVGW